MRALLSFLVDFFLLLTGTLIAFLLRSNFTISEERLVAAAPYIVATALVAAVAIPILRLNRTIWRMSSMPDYLRIVKAVAVVVIGAVALTFAYNRLEGVARTLPIIQSIMAISMLVGARVLLRLHHTTRQTRKIAMAPLKIVADGPAQTVLVVGLSRLTETYLQSIDELASARIKVAGLLGRNERHVGRLVGKHNVLGLPEQIEQVIGDLELHGVMVDQIVVTQLFSSLSPDAREALLRIEKIGSIKLQFLAERLGLEPKTDKLPGENMDVDKYAKQQLKLTISPEQIELLAKRPYWKIKRCIDFFGATILIVVLAPLILLVGILVAINIGLPVAFWQQRPGLGGRPFRLYKFRTMATEHASDGRKLSDDERTSSLGNFLRRTRLDELPQLFNILFGHMAFIGPRPLLPRDQSEAHRSRLLVRPGLTGWAQVIGGRTISPEDKAVLDVWYIQNTSLLRDLEIVGRTVPLVLFGERTYEALIERAWRDLRKAGTLTLSDDLVQEVHEAHYRSVA